MIPGIARLPVVVLFAALAAGCAGEPEPAGGDPAGAPGPEAWARREAHRDLLRERLGAAYDEPLPAALDPDTRRSAARLYDQLCAACHGPDGRGAGAVAAALPMPPADLTDPRIHELYSQRATLEILRHGVPDTPMTGWEGALSDDDLVALTLYVRGLADGEAPAR